MRNTSLASNRNTFIKRFKNTENFIKNKFGSDRKKVVALQSGFVRNTEKFFRKSLKFF